MLPTGPCLTPHAPLSLRSSSVPYNVTIGISEPTPILTARRSQIDGVCLQRKPHNQLCKTVLLPLSQVGQSEPVLRIALQSESDGIKLAVQGIQKGTSKLQKTQEYTGIRAGQSSLYPLRKTI